MECVRMDKTDCLGLLRCGVDAHTLGLTSVAQLLADAGYRCVAADAATCAAAERLEDPVCADRIAAWLREHRITALGFSYRLDPEEGAARFDRLVHELAERRFFLERGGPLKALYFAGLPPACERVRRRVPRVTATFSGDETPTETLRLLGIDSREDAGAATEAMVYDEARLAFGRDLVRRGTYLAVKPVDRSGYPEFGTAADGLIARLQYSQSRQLPPLMRAHAGPYLPHRREAVKLFLDWTKRLARSGLLDVLSIGTSQLTQSHFGRDWGHLPNGGGVPLNGEDEFAAVWAAARPMLVRTYSGTREIPALARLYERTIHNAWHALSFWWFCQIDGRGPYPVRENLREHLETLGYVAGIGKPFEPNVPHHFAFRGADDVTYVVAAVLAARTAKAAGIRHLVQQVMLNTPKYTWGVQDLAKARALLTLVRELEDERFQVILQPRGGLDYFSPNPTKAKAQLAAVTALMADIQPEVTSGPPIIHVVSHSEGTVLADPDVIHESIQITRQALNEYRDLRAKGYFPDMGRNPEVEDRTRELLSDARLVLRAIETAVPNVYSADGLYQVLAMGFLPLPYLWECRDEFANAVRWQTRVIRGAVKVVDDTGVPVSAVERVNRTITAAALTKRTEGNVGEALS